MLRSFGTIFGARHGTGTPWLVALHGWARTHSDFNAAFGRGGGDEVDSIAVDLAGFGATPAPLEAWGSEDYARSLHDLMEKTSAELGRGVVVVGHSFGGRVALRLARQRPDLVSGLVLTGVPQLERASGRKKPPLGYKVVRAAHKAGMVSEAKMDAWRYRYGSPDYRQAQGVMRETFVKLVNEDYEEDLASLTCPVELVWGDGDTAAPVDMAGRVAARLPTSHLTICPGVGHMVPLEAPGELRAACQRIRP